MESVIVLPTFLLLLITPTVTAASINPYNITHGNATPTRQDRLVYDEQERGAQIVVVVEPIECVDRCHRPLHESRTSLNALTYPRMLQRIDALCPVQYTTLQCARECVDFEGKTHLLSKINYVGFICDRMSIFSEYRGCYERTVTDGTLNQCSAACGRQFRQLSDAEFSSSSSRLRRSCQLTQCKHSCIEALIFESCAPSSTRKRIEASSLITRWLAIDFRTERITGFTSDSSVGDDAVPSECAWVDDATRVPRALRNKGDRCTQMIGSVLFFIICVALWV